MKKQILFIVLVMLTALLLAACQGENYKPEPAELTLAEPLQVCAELENYVSMTVTGKTSNTVFVTIQNDSSWTLGTELPYTLEVYDNGQWWSIPLSDFVAFPSISGPDILPNGSFRFNDDLSIFPLFPVQGAERYRIRREVIAPGVQIDEHGNRREEFGPGTRHDLVAEFYWEE